MKYSILAALRRHVCLTCFVMALSACGGGGSGGDAASGVGNAAVPTDSVAVSNPMPLLVGSQWLYRDESGRFEVQTVTALRTVQGVQAAVLLSRPLGQGDVGEETLLANVGDGLVELPAADDAVAQAIGNVRVLPLPLRVGANAVVLDRSVANGPDVDGDGRPDALTIHIEQQVVALETVTVAAGSFVGSARVRTVLRLGATASSSGRASATTTTVDEWYAPEIGLVRDSSVTDAGGVRSSTSRELTAFSVGGRRSDTQAPSVSSRTPPVDSVSRFVDRVVVGFDEPVDPGTALSGGLSLRNSVGELVASTAQQINANQFELRPARTLPSGSYTVGVSASVADLIGNTRPAQSWVFSVDRSGPAVLRSTPAAGANDVALDTPLELVFDEPFTPASANAASIQLHDRFGAALSASVTVVDSRTVRLTPPGPLAAGETYSLWVGLLLSDALGNSNDNAIEIRFKTVQGLFSYPAQLGGSGTGRGLVVADFTGDGRPDVLDFPDSSTPALRLQARLPGGGFDVPRLLPLPDAANCGGGGAFRVVDIDGDGRPDVVINRARDCGIQVLRQTADGSLAVLAAFPSSSAYKLVVADLNGDGRPDIVASSALNDTVNVWWQIAPGVFGPATNMPAIDNIRGDLAVGDVTGDGRPDLVLTSGLSSIDRKLVILPQQSDGSFGAPQSRALPSGTLELPLALADLNRDGRLDVIFQTGSGSLSVLRQEINGTLAAPVSLPGFDDGANIAIADFDGDGRPDVVSINQFGSTVRVYLQTADGSFGAGRNYSAAGTGSGSQLGVLDADGDGRPDLVVGGPWLLLNLGTAQSPGSPATVRPGFGLLRRLPGAAATAH